MAECHILLKDEYFHLRSIKLGRKFFPKRLDIFGIYGAIDKRKPAYTIRRHATPNHNSRWKFYRTFKAIFMKSLKCRSKDLLSKIKKHRHQI